MNNSYHPNHPTPLSTRRGAGGEAVGGEAIGSEAGPGTLSLTELAMAYAPGLSEGAARRRLNQWLRTSPDLMAKLRAAGFHDRQRVLTPRQVKIIYEHLGEP